MRTGLVVGLVLWVVVPTTTLARDVSDIVNAMGTSTAEFQDNKKRLIGDTLEGDGTVLDAKRAFEAGIFDVYIASGDKVGVVVVVPVSSREIPFQWRMQSDFQGASRTFPFAGT